MIDAPLDAHPADDGSGPQRPPSQRGFRVLFRNRFGHWRAGWRLALYLVIIIAFGFGAGALIGLLMPEVADEGFTSWPRIVMLTAQCLFLIVAALLMLRWFDRRPGDLLGVGIGPGWLRELAIGLAAGVMAITGLAVVLLVTGSVSLELSADLGASLGALLPCLVIFTMAATAEELIFRGYPLQALAEGTRPWIAAVLLSVLFGIGHLGNPDISAISVLNIVLVGLVLAAMYFLTRRLWLPIGFHLSWNWAQSWLWGFDVSGITIEESLVVTTPTGAELITGGGFGLEGSVLTTALMAAALIVLIRGRALTPTPEMTALWAPYPRGFGLAPAAAPDQQDTLPPRSAELPVSARSED